MGFHAAFTRTELPCCFAMIFLGVTISRPVPLPTALAPDLCIPLPLIPRSYPAVLSGPMLELCSVRQGSMLRGKILQLRMNYKP
jgi:hypothetical protein